jgi:hypothetical protein
MCRSYFRETFTINQCLKEFFFIAELITVKPEQKGGDLVITQSLLEAAVKTIKPEALILRTLPNETDKMNRQYSGSNPAYLSEDAAGLDGGSRREPSLAGPPFRGQGR